MKFLSAISKYFNQKHPVILSGFAGIISAMITSAIFIWRGLSLSPDSWAYWEGSVSLMKNTGYTFFGGQPIATFPPLFSMYLTIFQLLGGINSFSLMLSLIVLSFSAGFAWTYLFTLLSDRLSLSTLPAFFCILLLCPFLGMICTALLSESLFIFLLSLLFIALQQESGFSIKNSMRFVRKSTFLIMIITGLLLTRNMSVVLLPGIFIVLLIISKDKLTVRFIYAAAIISLPVLIYLGIFKILGLNDFREIGFFYGRYTPEQYLNQMFSGLANLWGPLKYGIGYFILAAVMLITFYSIFILFPKIKHVNPAIIAIMIIMFSSLAGLYAVFNFTWIHDELKGRFLYHIYIITVIFLVSVSSWIKEKTVYLVYTIVLSLIFSGMLLYAGEKIIAKASAANLREIHLKKGKGADYEKSTESWNFIAHGNLTISENYLNKGPVKTGRLLLVSPPNYPWIDRNYSSKLKSLAPSE